MYILAQKHTHTQLSYNDPVNPDRPNQFKYTVEFLRDKVSSDEEEDDRNEEISVSNTLFNVATISLQSANENLMNLKTRVKSMVAHLSDGCKKHVEEFLAELSAIVPEKQLPEPIILPRRSSSLSSPELFRHRSISVWDVVPVVGSVKTIIEGCEDVSDGHSASAVTNLALGSLSLG